MKDWSLVYHRFEPDHEGLREALCTLGNGYLATRGAAAEAGADGVHYPGTYMAGCYNRLESEISGRVVENEDFVNLPNWLPLTFRIDEGAWFDLRAVEVDSFRQELDLRDGILLREVRFRDAHGRRTALRNRRLVHMGSPHFAALESTIRSENWSGRLEFRAALDGRVRNRGVARYRDLADAHLSPIETDSEGETMFLKVQTSQSELRIAQAARTRLLRDGEPVPVERRKVEEPGYVAQEFGLDLAPGGSATVEKVVALYTSRDHAISECGAEARSAVAGAPDFEKLCRTQRETWDYLWRQFDINLDGARPEESERTALVLRLHVFHLLQTASLNNLDLDAGVPARGLHGEAYRGHVFWDELFIFPLLNLRMPEVTRALLMYRYRRLGKARAAARAAGFAGAMYPWQSGSNGREESQRVHLNPRSGRWVPDNTHLQRHINAAIAYNVWHYYQVTGDLEFLSFYGAEMILEIARFWASIAIHNRDLDRYEIRGVMGPDEYHDAYPGANEPGLNNNAYTNLMAVWVLCRAIEIPHLLPECERRRLCDKLHLNEAEFARWDEISRKMRLVFHDDGIISQFEGYDRLDEFDWQGYRERYGDIRRLDRILEAEEDTPNRYKASKQADVLMLFYLFSSQELGKLFARLDYPFDSEMIRRNVEYYLRRTSHGSTLSRVVHSWVLARSDRAASWRWFREALESDVGEQGDGTTQEGVHLGAMAGTVDVMQRCYTGIDTRGEVLYLNPRLPSELDRLGLRIRFRGHSLGLELTQDRLLVRAERCAARAMKVGVKDRIYELGSGEVIEFTA